MDNQNFKSFFIDYYDHPTLVIVFDQHNPPNQSTPLSEQQFQQILAILNHKGSDDSSSPQSHSAAMVVRSSKPNQSYSSDRVCSSFSNARPFDQDKHRVGSFQGRTQCSNSQANAAVTKSGLSKITSCSWIIDSGATDHISSSPKLFSHKSKNCSLPPVLLPSGEKANIVAKGSLPLNSVYYLRDALCVPTFKVDLLSVSRLTMGLNCSITFFPYWCVLQDLATRKMIGLGKQRDGLYYLEALTKQKTLTNSHSSPNPRPVCNLTTSSTDL